MASLFNEFRLKDVVLRNRIAVSPMCQYSSDNGFPNDWHFVHLGSRAVGGAGLVMVEATAVSPEGRISPADSGIYLDDHVQPFARIAASSSSTGPSPASNSLTPVARPASPSRGKAATTSSSGKGGWDIIAPSAVAFGGKLPKVPREMTVQDIAQVQEAFVAAARRALAAGLRVAGTALRSRLSRPRVLFAARQQKDRQLRRQLREPDSVSAGDVRRRPQGLAGTIPVDRSTLGDGLDRGRRDRR